MRASRPNTPAASGSFKLADDSSIQLMFIRHSIPIPARERKGISQTNDPGLTFSGTSQAQDLVGRLSPVFGLAASRNANTMLVSSPMLCSLETAAPVAAVVGAELLVHGEMFEYGAAGTGFRGRTEAETLGALGESCGVQCTHFLPVERGGTWNYGGDSVRETEAEFRERAERVKQWIEGTLVPQLSGPNGGVGIIVAHQSLLDILALLLLGGSSSSWTYGSQRFKLDFAEMRELEGAFEENASPGISGQPFLTRTLSWSDRVHFPAGISSHSKMADRHRSKEHISNIRRP